MRLPNRAPEPALAYPAWSRRLGGLAAGIDLNPDGSCNWRCAYCDVPGLRDAKGPEVQPAALEAGLAATLEALAAGDVELAGVPEDQREVRGVLVSGRGEPTLSFQLPAAIELAARTARERGLRAALVTNGSNVSSRKSREALEGFGDANGEIWFKLDTATREGLESWNRTDQILRHVRESMRVAAGLAPTWIQTVVAGGAGALELSGKEADEYVSFLGVQLKSRVPLRGVHLLGLDRPSAQEGASGLGRADASLVNSLAERVRELGLEVQVFA